MRIRRVLADVALVDVVCPHRVERGDVARHAGHEGRHQRRDAHAEHARWDRTGPSASSAPGRNPDRRRLQRDAVADAHLRERHRRDARHDHDERHEHLRERGDQRRVAAPRTSNRRPWPAAPPGSPCTSTRTKARSPARPPCRRSRRPSGCPRVAHVLPGVRHHGSEAAAGMPSQPPAFVHRQDRPAARSPARSGRTAAPRCRSRSSARPGTYRQARSPPTAAPRP